MGLFNHFPYPDTHQLNLDWILETVKSCVDKVTELWTYVREPGAGIQKALTDAQAAATNAQTSATSAQASSANARTSAIGAEANAANAQTSANDPQTSADDAHTPADDAQAAATTAQTAATSAQAALTDSNAAANTAQTSARNAQTAEMNAKKSANDAKQYLADVQTIMGKLYPVGAVYVNFWNQAMTLESDATVIARLQALTGGTWARAGSHGQPVKTSGMLGWATVMLGDAAGSANDINFNIYVRKA